ncbi:Synaptonemal complex protein 3 [Cricetulus griseus]|uniref:Synaptonemal complex protein 3 n=1 Tax=Cricetulus griseus TaxID=10029 RepID=G3H6L7_CRIGR|nr:Synaptonemal complex protein 3 [Cricetulus griseus]
MEGVADRKMEGVADLVLEAADGKMEEEADRKREGAADLVLEAADGKMEGAADGKMEEAAKLVLEATDGKMEGAADLVLEAADGKMEGVADGKMEGHADRKMEGVVDLVLENDFQHEEKIFQQCRLIQNQRLRTIKHVHEQFLKNLEDLEKKNDMQFLSTQNELKEEMNKLRRKIMKESVSCVSNWKDELIKALKSFVS